MREAPVGDSHSATSCATCSLWSIAKSSKIIKTEKLFSADLKIARDAKFFLTEGSKTATFSCEAEAPTGPAAYVLLPSLNSHPLNKQIPVSYENLQLSMVSR